MKALNLKTIKNVTMVCGPVNSGKNMFMNEMAKLLSTTNTWVLKIATESREFGVYIDGRCDIEGIVSYLKNTINTTVFIEQSEWHNNPWSNSDDVYRQELGMLHRISETNQLKFYIGVSTGRSGYANFGPL